MPDEQELKNTLLELRQKGYSEEQIAQALRPAPITPTVGLFQRKMDTITTIVGIGLSLIVIALVIIVTTHWENIGPWGKIMLVFVPIIILYLIAALTYNRPEQKEVNEGTFLFATFLIPLLLGTVLFQLRVWPKIDASLFGWCSLAGWFIFYLIELGQNKSRLSPLTLLFLMSGFSSFLVWYEINSDLVYWAYLVFGVSIVMIGLLYSLWRKGPAAARLIFGTIIAALSLPLVLIHQLLKLRVDWEGISWALVALGLAYWLVHYIFPRRDESDEWSAGLKTVNQGLGEGSWLLIQLPLIILLFKNDVYGPIVFIVSLVVALLSITLPLQILVPVGSAGMFFSLLFMAFNSQVLIYPTLAIIFGIGLVLASIKIKIDNFIPIGALATVIAILVLSQNIFAGTLGWPVTIFILGLIFLGLGIMLNRVKHWRSEQMVTYRPKV